MKIIINQPRASYYVGGAEIISFQHAKYLSETDSVFFITINPLSIGKNYSSHYLEFKNKASSGIKFIELFFDAKFGYIFEISEGVNRLRWNWESLVYGKYLRDFIEKNDEKIDASISYYILDGINISDKIINNCLYLCGTPKERDDFQGSFLIFYNKIISISEEVSEYWQRYTKIPLPVINTGVDYQRFKPAIKKEFGVKVVGYIGRMLERKGVYIFGEIAKKISQNNSNIIFAMAGDGPELNKLKSLYSKYIDFKGIVDKPEEFIGGCDLLVFPSLYGEGIQGVILEGMACNVKIMAGKSKANEKLLSERRGVIIDRSMTIDEIILIIEGYINNSEKCKSRDYIKDNHDWRKITKELRRQIV